MNPEVGGEITSFMNEESFPRCICEAPLCEGNCSGVPIHMGLCEACLEDCK